MDIVVEMVNKKKFFIVFMLLSAVICTIYFVSSCLYVIDADTVINNEKCKGKRLKSLEGSNISSYSCGVYLTDDGIAYKCEADMANLAGDSPPPNYKPYR